METKKYYHRKKKKQSKNFFVDPYLDSIKRKQKTYAPPQGGDDVQGFFFLVLGDASPGFFESTGEWPPPLIVVPPLALAVGLVGALRPSWWAFNSNCSSFFHKSSRSFSFFFSLKRNQFLFCFLLCCFYFLFQVILLLFLFINKKLQRNYYFCLSAL